MINPDDLDPPKKSLKPLDLQPLSVGELQDYIASLEAEIARAEDAIKKKEAHKSGVDALFGGSKK
jgi:uncharacterized small protein (DUF1192 family)